MYRHVSICIDSPACTDPQSDRKGPAPGEALGDSVRLGGAKRAPLLSTRRVSRLGKVASVLGVMAAGLFATVPAFAASGEEAAAEALFIEAKKMMAEGNLTAACAKLAESQRLDPAVGTLLNLGECYEKKGQTASAWVAFRSAASMGRKNRQEERERFAKDRATALESKLTKLVIAVEGPGRTPGLVVQRDGTELQEASLGAAIPVDPGVHVVEARSPGKKTWTKTVDLATAGTTTVTIPVLENEPFAPVLPATTTTPAPLTTAPPPIAPEQVPDRPAPRPGSTQKTLAWVAGGVGVAGLIVGTVFGINANSKKKDAEAYCRPSPGDWHCSQPGVDLLSQAQTAATVSTIGFILGAAGLAGGVTLYVTAPTQHGGTASLGVRGTF